MRIDSSRLLNAALLGLVVTAAAAACGSDDGKKNVQDVTGGAGGEAGAKPISAGGGTEQPAGGVGGETAEVAGGNGGAPPVAMAGEGGAPVVVEMGGAGGAPPEVLPPVNCDPVMFVDPKLEDAIRTALDRVGVITPDDIAGLTALDARGYEVADLSGIECFTELTDLDLGYGGAASQVTDLRPLRYLQKLESLDLSGNPLESLDGLGDLPTLQDLRLDNTTDGLDLAPLADAPALVQLDLRSNVVDDLTPVGKIATLEGVALDGSTFTTPSTLDQLTQITRLSVTGTQLDDATPLAALTQLTELDIGYNGPLANFGKLGALVNLTRLSAASDGLVDITAIGSMTKLDYLDLYGNPITDITVLVNNAGISAGNTVYLNGTSLDCAAQAANLKALTDRQVTVSSPCN